ncbi:hypothetical protein Tco_1429388 [Tanacetum coccineum]
MEVEISNGKGGSLGKIKFSFELKVSNGCSALFLKDIRHADAALLMNHFPRLYALDLNQECFIKDCWRLVNGSWADNWEWKAPPRGRSFAELSSILPISGGIYLDMNGDDKWTWKMNASGSNKVNMLACGLQDILLTKQNIGPHHIWNSLVPHVGEKLGVSGSLIPPFHSSRFHNSDINLENFANLGCPKLNKDLIVKRKKVEFGIFLVYPLADQYYFPIRKGSA